MRKKYHDNIPAAEAAQGSFTLVVYIMNRMSRLLNIKACHRVFYVLMAYMDVTTMGRTINRFIKDPNVLDNEMGDKMAMLTLFKFILVGILILCIIYFPCFAIAVPFLVFFFLMVAGFYQASGREIKRLEVVQCSKMYRNFNESLIGMGTINIYHKNDAFLRRKAQLIDKMNEAY